MHRLAPLLLILAFLTGCRQSPAPAATSVTARPKAAPTDPWPHVDSVDPATLTASGGKVWINALRVRYHIDAADRVEKAQLLLYNSETGPIASIPVPAQAQGEFDWDVRTTADLGPSVRLRASCPSGFGDWVALGAPGGSEPHVTPSSIKEAETPEEQGMMDQPGVIVPISFWGSGFEPACKLQASIDNGAVMDLSTTYGGPSRLDAQIYRHDLNYRGVGPRYLELKFIIRGQGFARENIFVVPVADE